MTSRTSEACHRHPLTIASAGLLLKHGGASVPASRSARPDPLNPFANQLAEHSDDLPSLRRFNVVRIRAQLLGAFSIHIQFRTAVDHHRQVSEFWLRTSPLEYIESALDGHFEIKD